jgi:hypothetical protein
MGGWGMWNLTGLQVQGTAVPSPPSKQEGKQVVLRRHEGNDSDNSVFWQLYSVSH